MNEEQLDEQEEESNPASDLADAMADPDGGFVTPEKKKVNQGTLVLFAILLAGAAGTYFMYLKTGPQQATAANAADAEAADTTINNFLTNGDRSIRDMEQMLQETEKVVEEFQNHSNKPQVPLADLPTNPFRYISLRPETTVRDQEDLKKKRETERMEALKAVQSLHLQSILFSDARRACMINNRMYSEGDQINEFTIEKISQGAVIVKRGAFRFELQMQR